MKAYTVFLPQFDEVRDHRTYSDTLKTVDSEDTCTDDRNVRFAAINKELMMKSYSKKTMGQMDRGNFFVVMLITLCFLLTLAGCSNIVENSGTGKPNPPEDGSGLVAVTGEICLSGAFPKALQSSSGSQRTAIPTVGAVTYTVTAQNKAEPGEMITAVVEDNFTYTLYLSPGNWILTCSGVNDSGGQIIREKTPIELTVTQGESIPVPGALELFLIQTPGEGGSGAVSLNGAINFVKDGSAATVAVDITLTPWESSVTVPDIPRQTITGNGNFTVTLDDVPSGAYMMRLVFSVDGVAVSTVEEAVNVFDNMTTDTWYLGGGNSDHLTLEGDGSVSFNLTRCRTEFFIDGTGGDDTNSGSALKPLKTVGKVFSVLGKIKGADTAKITLQSDAGDTSGVTVPEGVNAVIFGEQAASVPVQITVGEGAAVKVGTNVTCSGGAMVQNGGVLTLTQGGRIDGSNLTSGIKNNSGGAVYVEGGTFTMESGSTVTGGNVSANGGAVYVDSGTFTMNGGKISDGNAILGGNGVFVNIGDFVMNGGEITECGKGSQPGNGAVMIYKSASGDGAGRFVMKSGKIYGNSAEQGAGVFVNGGIFEMSGGSISENTATGPTGSGGAVYVYNGSFDMSGNAAINNNQSSMDAGGVFVGGIGTFTVSGTPIITGNTVNGTANNVYLSDGKTITIGDGGLTGGSIGVTVGDMIAGNAVQITDIDVTGAADRFTSDISSYSIEETIATTSGGIAVFLSDADVSYQESSALARSLGALSDAVSEANTWNEGGTITLMKNIDGTNAVWGTGPITFSGGTDTVPIILNLNGKTIDRGLTEAVSDGQVIVIKSNGNLTIKDSSANSDGTGGSGKITGGNVAEDSSDSLNGGGICIEDGSLTLESGSISKNKAATEGGGVYVDSNGTFTMAGGIISENSITSNNGNAHGGGVYVAGGSFTMRGGTVSNNGEKSSGVYIDKGGAVYIDKGNFTLSNGKITQNYAVNGAGIYIASGGSFTMTEGNITGNTANTNGGGVYVDGTFIVGNTLTITGNTVSGNANNVYLPSGKTITCDSQGLSGGSIGITVGVPPSSVGNSIDIAYFIVKEPASIFKSDTGGLSIGSTLDKIILKKITYTGSLDTITRDTEDTIYIGDATIDKSSDYQTSAIDAVGASGKTVTLDISGTNEFHAGGDRPGIYVPSDGTLKITGGGTLKVYGGASWPAIGLNGGKPGVGNGTIEIAGGTIYAYAGSNAAAIGGSWGCPVAAENKINVTISGGEVFADSTSGWGWRAIGPGRAGNDDVSAAGTVTCTIAPTAGYQIRVYAGSSQYNASEIPGSPFTVSTDITDKIKDSKFVHTVTEKIP